MAAPTTATSGRGRPPAPASRGGSHRRVPSGTDNPEIPGSTAWAADRTDSTFRQIDYWARAGWLGAHHQGLGSGKRRRFTDDDLEVVVALRQMTSLGAIEKWLGIAATTVRAQRVRPGEWLAVSLSGVAVRIVPPIVPVAEPSWLIPLQPFDEGRPL